MLLGITGTNGSGKDTVAEYLKNRGFSFFSLSDVIREEGRKRGIDLTRENMVRLGNELRTKFGADVLAKRVSDEIEKKGIKNAVIVSIRNFSEVEHFRNRFKKFFLIALDAPIDVRYKRIRKRADKKDKRDEISFEEFKRLEEKEFFGKDNEQQLAKVISASDKKIINDGSVKDLYKKIDELIFSKLVDLGKDISIHDLPADWMIKNISGKKVNFSRIPKDQYYLKIAMLVSERSTCIRHHVGAIAVKDNRIIATGYNGAPSKLPDCLELGCLRNQLNIASGTKSEICRAVHAEQNIVAQAALHGHSLKGATVYCTHSPCITCAKLLINSGIKRYVFFTEFSDTSFIELFQAAGIEIKKLKKPDEKLYFKP